MRTLSVRTVKAESVPSLMPSVVALLVEATRLGTGEGECLSCVELTRWAP